MQAEKNGSQTKETIKKTFLELIKRKDFHDLTAKEIIDCSYVNKSTFYRHFHSKYELLDEVTRDLLDGFGALLAAPAKCGFQFDRMEAHFYSYFAYIQDHYDLYQRLLSIPESSFLELQQRYIYEFFRRNKRYPSVINLSEKQQEMRPLMLSWLYSGMIVYWISEKLATPIEDMVGRLTAFWMHYYMMDSPD